MLTPSTGSIISTLHQKTTRKLRPWWSSAQTMRAIFAANATTATLGCARARSARSHFPVAVSFRDTTGMAARAPWISIFRK